MPFFTLNIMYIGVFLVIIIAAASYALFYFLQKDNEKTIRESVFEQQLDRQSKSTELITQRIGSDLRLITSMLQEMSDSIYLQNAMLSGDKINNLLDEKFRQLNTVSRVDSVLITDENGIITTQNSWKGLETFVNIDLSEREYMKVARKTLQPVYSDGFTGIDGIYRIAVTVPIISLEDGHYIGTIVANLPAVEFFRNYGNVHDIDSQFLVSFDKKGYLLAVGASGELVGKNFFGNETQIFINHNPILNNLTRTLLMGKAGSATYDYGKGERLNTQAPILVGSEPVYFLQVVTPTDRIYSNINSILFTEGTKMFLLLIGTTLSILVIVFILRKWYSILEDQVSKRTAELNESNYSLKVANESLKNKDEAQNQFINVAAHELRTPIQPILNAIYLMESSNLAPEKRSQYTDIIKRNTQKLSRLAEDILDVTKIESKTLKLVIEEFNLHDLILSVVEEFRNNVRLVHSDLSVDYKFIDKSVLVKGDKSRLSQLMFILLDNAGKFTKYGSILVTSQVKSNNVQVTVEDTGSGIDQEILPQLFKKFVTRSDRGTGLGLFIAKNIVEAHGGIIWAENKPHQKGAIFMFTLPLRSANDKYADEVSTGE